MIPAPSKKLSIILTVCGLALVVLPFLLATFYVHPSSDDYSYAYFYNRYGFIGGQREIFTHCTGRFFATFLMAANPVRWHQPDIYRLVLCAIFLLFVCSFYCLLFVWTKDRATAFQQWALSTFLFCLYLFLLPSPAHAFYWLNGSTTYTVSAILFCWALICLIHIHRRTKHISRNYALLFLMTPCICGSNEVAALSMTALALGTAWITVRKTRKIPLPTLIWILLCLTATGISSAAAGNQLRMTHAPFSGYLLLAAGGGLYAATGNLLQWMALLIPAMVFYLFTWEMPMLRRHPEENKYPVRAPILFTCAWVLVYMLIHIIIVWAMGSVPEKRTENILLFGVLLCSLFSTHLFAGAYAVRLWSAEQAIGKGVRIVTAILLSGWCFQYDNAWFQVCFDWLSGSIRQYDRELTAAYKRLEADPAGSCYLEPLSNRPRSLYIGNTIGTSPDPATATVISASFAQYRNKSWIYTSPVPAPASYREQWPELLKQLRAGIK